LLKAWKVRLTALREADGYAYDWQGAEIDPTINLLTDVVDTPFALIEPTVDSERFYEPADQTLELFRGNVTMKHAVSDLLDRVARITVAEHLIADLERAVCNDAVGGSSFGGLCIDTRLMASQSFVGIGSPIVLVVVPFTQRHRRTYGAP
jgi:hypothetical protein